MKYARILRDDVSGRFRKGEIGLILINDFSSHYDYKLYLGNAWAEPLGGGVPHTIQRIFYFLAEEIEEIDR